MRKPWVLLRGLTREQLHWGDFMSMFQKEVSQEVVCIDFPGVGEYYQQSSPRSIEKIAEHVLDQINARGMKACHVLAHSMGAMVSAAMLDMQPDKFDRVVWMNTSFSNVSPWYKRLKIQSALKHSKSFVFVNDIYQREKTTYQLTTNLHKQPDLIDVWVDIQKKHPVSLQTCVNQLWAASRFSFSMKTNKPVLLLGALQDRFVDQQCTKDIAEVLEVPFYMHPTAGHDISVDDPMWIINSIKQRYPLL